MDEMAVSDKAGMKNLQLTEAFPTSNKMTTTTTTTTIHRNHHYRPLLSSSMFDNDHTSWDDGGGNGPTSDMPMTYSNHIYQAVAGSPCAHNAINTSDSSDSVCVRPLQPLDIFISTSTRTSTTARATTAFKSPAAGMADSLGFPFTNAQWKELQRQAMIYKYMVASVPVPPDLLIPLARGTPVTDNSHSPLDGGFNLRLASGADPEPGRCRRTDGKKWRCSRDVAPNHKYCERHMHRGRPRSRKPVEVHANNTSSSSHHVKKCRYDCNAFSSTSPATVAISSPTKTSSSASCLSSAINQPYPQSQVSLDKFAFKATNFDSMTSLSSDKGPRGLDWMLKDDAVSLSHSNLWQPLMQAKIGLSPESSCHHSISLSNPNYEDSMFLNSYAIFSSEEQQNRDCPLFFNHDILPMENSPQSENCRGFIDAWSNSKTHENDTHQRTESCVSPNGKLSLSSLNLSMGTNSDRDEDMGDIHMGLGLMGTNCNTDNGTKTHLSSWLTPTSWVSSTPGGPLAEVLRPSTVPATKDAASNPSSPVVTNGESGSPIATVASSPSGVLQKTVNSLSDSSTASSPTNASSRANSEMAMLWTSQNKLSSSTKPQNIN